MYAREKSTAVLKYQDRLQAMLSDILYISGLGINLLSAQYLCQRGLIGSFNENRIYFKNGKNIIIKAIIQNGLYIVSHVANNPRAEKDLIFMLNDINIINTDNRDDEDNLKLSKNNIERYLLFY